MDEDVQFARGHRLNTLLFATFRSGWLRAGGDDDLDLIRAEYRLHLMRTAEAVKGGGQPL